MNELLEQKRSELEKVKAEEEALWEKLHDIDEIRKKVSCEWNEKYEQMKKLDVEVDELEHEIPSAEDQPK